MTKIDRKQDLKHLYQPSARAVAQVEVPAFRYLMVDRAGDPDTSPHCAAAVEARFSVSCTGRFMSGRGVRHRLRGDAAGRPVVVGRPGCVRRRRPVELAVTMTIHQPPFVDTSVPHDAPADVKRKKGLAAVDAPRLEPFTAGVSAQTLPVGPFTAEGPTIQRVHDFIEARGSLAASTTTST